VVSASQYGKIAVALGRKRAIIISFFFIAIACSVIGLIDEPSELWITCLMMMIYGFFLFITWPGLFAMISDATGKVSQGFIFSIIFAGQIVGGATLAYIAGRVAEVYGIGSPFLILSGLMFVPIVTLLFHKGENK
jgi:MFS family permease